MPRGPRTDDPRAARPGGPARQAGRRPAAGRGQRALLTAVCLAGLVGCGSQALGELPPPAGPDRSPVLTVAPRGEPRPTTPRRAAPTTEVTFRDGGLRAVLRPHERVLEIRDAGGRVRSRQTAGVGPTQVACVPEGPCYVVDTQGDALLVFRVGPGGHDLRLSRRVYVAGAPYAIALDPERRRLWITLTARNELVELAAHGRPHLLQRLPTIRQPNAVSVDRATGDVTVRSPSGEAVVLRDPASPDR